MDEFIDIIREKCESEKIIGILHLLLHADDTVVLSTEKALFIQKCNTLIKAFANKKVSMNFKKSGFLIINPKYSSDRTDIKLNKGWLSYKSTFVYLGSIFSDNGALHHDVNLHADDKAKSVYIKLANFIRNNPSAPVTIKRKVLMSCMNAALLYSCETWGGSSLNKIEILYRKAIKITFGMSQKTPNEIIFLETGLTNLKAEIYKRQFKFWNKMSSKFETDRFSSVGSILNMALNKNIHYLRHYRKLQKNFHDGEACFKFYKNQFTDTTKENVRSKSTTQVYGLLKDYIGINRDLSIPEFYSKYLLRETERLILTKYRSGSHNLKIVTGSFYRTPLEERKCKCKEIQTLHHVIFDCTFTQMIRDGNFPRSLHEFFKDDTFAATKLRLVEKILHLR